MITLAPAGNPHNNTLALAAKKDLDETKRSGACISIRDTTQCPLPDDNIPLISDIVQQIAGSAVFITTDLRQAYHRLPIHEQEQLLTGFVHDGKQ